MNVNWRVLTIIMVVILIGLGVWVWRYGGTTRIEKIRQFGGGGGAVILIR
jgi:hypothetical protein